MTLKSMKSKSIRKRPKYNFNTISYDRYSFILGGMKILTDYLTKQTNNLLIKLYRKNQLNVLVDKIRHYDQYNERYIVLTENEALEMIKYLTLRKKRSLLEKMFEKNEMFMRKINKQEMKRDQNLQYQKPNNFYLQCKRLIYQTFTKLYNQVKETTSQLKPRLNDCQVELRKFMQEKILSIEMQLFVSTIVMIVEQHSEQKSEDGNNKMFKPVNCFVIFQQSYPPKSFSKKELINMIGQQQYLTKKLHTLKIYDISIASEHFLNPTFVTCHDCMRVVTNIGFPQHDLKCLKTVNGEKQKNIQSHFLLTPQKFLDKFINHEFFNSYDGEKGFQHPYVQYLLKTGNDKFACGRNWCGPCRIKYKRGMSMTHCDFCDSICQCPRCKRYEKFVQFLGHYLKIGGKISDIENKFVFNQVFDYQESLKTSNRQGFESDDKLKDLIFKKHLKQMYESQIKKKDNLISSTLWQYLKKSSLLSGIFPEENTAEFSSFIFFHKDQLKKKNKDQMNKIYEIERKNYNKYALERKEKNIEITTSKLDESVKTKIIQAQTEQFMILKRKFQKSKILKTSNPLTNHRMAIDNSGVIIISQSSLRKNERKFHQTIQTKEQNPLGGVKQQRQYVKAKRQEHQQKRHLTIKSSKERIILQKDEKFGSINYISDENKSQIENDENDDERQNYGSIWQ